MSYINRTIIVERDSRKLTTQVLEVLTGSPRGFASRPDFLNWEATNDSKDGLVTFADGLGYEHSEGYSLPGLSNWRPFGDVLDIRHAGSTSDLSSDFVGIFEQAAIDAANRGWTLNVGPKADGTPYEYRFIDHTLANDLRVTFDNKTILLPAKNFQHFPTGGTVGPFSITDFPYDAGTDLPLSAMLVSGATETKFVQDVDFTVSGTSITLTASPPAGSTFVAINNHDALRFRSVSGNGRKLIVDGTVNIDLSNVGYALASASGSGLSTSNVDHIMLNRLWVKSPAGYGSASLDKRGDSGFVPLNYKSCQVNHIHAEGMNDLAVYSTGGGNAGSTEDDSRGLQIGSIYAKRCGTGAKHVRQAENAYIGSISLEECGTGFLCGDTGGIGSGGGIHIGSINAIRLGRRALDLRDYKGGLHVGAISVRDIGFLPDGVTPENAPSGVWFGGNVVGVQVDCLDVRQRDWSTPAGAPALQATGDNNYGNRILGGWIEGLDTGIKETGAVTNDVGNIYTLSMKDVATPIDTSGALQTHYDLILLSESDGTITQRRINNLWSETVTTDEPTFLLAGPAGEPSYSYATQELSYQRMLDYTQFTLSIQGNITHTETGKVLRIVLPSGISNAAPHPSPTILGRAIGLSLPSMDDGSPPAEGQQWGDVYAEIRAVSSTNHISLYYRPAGEGAPVEISSDHIVSGSTVRFEISGIVRVR